MTKPIDLEIIILSYNSSFWLKKTLATLEDHYLKQTKLTVKVTVVDNGSEDDSVAMVRRDFSWANVLALPENKGFSYGNNQALKQSTATYALLLNSDMELTEQSKFDELVAYLEEHRDVGIVTPRVEFVNGQLDPACHRGEPTPWAAFAYFSGLANLFPQSTWLNRYHLGYLDLATTHEIEACSGAAMLIRLKMLDEVGLLDERFFMYAEDLDLCKRVRDAGFKVIYYPGVRIIHHKYKSGIRGSSKKIARATRQHFYNTMLQYYDKHYAQHYPSIVRQVLHAVLVAKKGAL